ncbi:MAG: FAD-binding oxidoreductase, partial [Brucellaceae bacterium]|nr:FAD-binding oxidoreductase [Brucellaceae bacterium]
MTSSPESFSRSLWWNKTSEIKPDYPALKGAHEADIVIVGGGFTGLASAMFLAERGKKVIVLEARHIGFGASGRNGGQIIPGLKHDPEDLLSTYGAEHGRRMIDMVGGSADLVFDLIRRHNIQCAPVRSGWIQAAHSELAKSAVHKRARQWQAQGVEVEILDRSGVTKLSGTDHYLGGWRDPRAGAIQPLDYARGLARVAAANGAVIFE